MRILLFLFFALVSHHSFGQNMYSYSDSSMSVKVNKDFRMDVLATKQAEINKRAETLSANRSRRGYRIQVYNAQNRDEANAVKAELLRRFPDQKSYLLYQSPNFRVRFGNFLSQREASDLRKMLAALYPNRSIYVVPDMIEYTPPPEEEEL